MRILFTAALIMCTWYSQAQQEKIKPNKYPSLLWEITGKGLSKPSYLFGTMHVSNKMVFHLSDSFYTGIRNADVVALETNPESWQEDMSRYDMEGSVGNYNRFGFNYGYNAQPADYLTINRLKFGAYEKMVEVGLHSNPAIINSFLYRSFEYGADFEEDTYLDLYIYQVGKKWGKKLCGVEDFDESMRLMKEAYVDMAKDKSGKRKSFEYDENFSTSRLQEAYRTGNLDLLDTINQINSQSAAFDEKFLYKRNEIQANSIDSIIRSGSTLFVGVGAAHLPGHRGVIEMLRRKGYKLRPIKMMERDSRHKEEVEKIRVPVKFDHTTSEDGFFSANIPGRLYNFSGDMDQVQQRQYADMANGSYYVVTRIQTNAALWGHNTDAVYRKVDSVLYENIPGRILTKQPITRNGYKGFEITNRTRRGDFQRYNIFITPFEVLLFKMSGNGDYVKDGKEAEQFFSSIQLKGYERDWQVYSPSAGGFQAEMPHKPVESKGENWHFTSYEQTTESVYSVLRSDLHNYWFVGEDTLDLSLMEESFASSEFIDKQLSRKQTRFKGYPALDARYKLKDGSAVMARFIIQGPRYYTLVTRGKKEHPNMTKFLNSFTFTPFKYAQPKQQTDTSLYYTVMSPVPLEKSSKISMEPDVEDFRGIEGEENHMDAGIARDKLVESDSTGEKIHVLFSKSSRYYYEKDSVDVANDEELDRIKKKWNLRSSEVKDLPNKGKLWEYTVGGENSSRIIRTRVYYRDGVLYSLTSQGDTLTAPGAFVDNFFNTFKPADTVQSSNPFTKKTSVFFSDFFSKDTLLRKKAVASISIIDLDSADFPQLKKALQSLSWKEKKYLDVKDDFIGKLGSISTKESSDYLKDIYYSAGDTLAFQYTALEALLKQRTTYSYGVFRDILLNEPPVLNVSTSTGDDDYYGNVTMTSTMPEGYDRESYGSYNNGQFLDDLYDSTQLTAGIIKDILPLINVEDYEQPLMFLMANLVDSNLISSKDYELYYSKFLIEARQALKKQQISEKSKEIRDAQKDDEDEDENPYAQPYSSRGQGNSMLTLYSRLLMPFYDKNQPVQQLMEQLLRSSDKRVKYDAALLLARYKKPLPDTMIKHLAGIDDFRFKLYADLKKLDQLKLFPTSPNSNIDLAKAYIFEKSVYNRPDSIVYLDKTTVNVKGKTGIVYFFKYKKKDDASWKIATSGMFSADPKKFFMDGIDDEDYDSYDLTSLSEEKISKDEPLKQQLDKQLKKVIYRIKPSASRFYEGNRYGMGGYFE
jgi:uncharacterized protein YbaP (TraB family)